jgi:NADH-quinone oxidoreductase subunit C
VRVPAQALQEALGDDVEEIVSEGTHPFVRIKAARIVEASKVLKSECGVRMLHQISGVDYEDHMEVVYHFARYEPKPEFVCVKASVPRENPEIPSLAAEWDSANWGERETYDLLGIRFTGHPHLFRILLPEDWVGHPLRKDYEFPAEYHGIDCTQ